MRVPSLPRLLASAPAATPGRVLFGAFATPPLGATPPGGSGDVTIAFCSDEDIARRASADYPSLCGDSQMLARGSDGTFDGLPGDPWTMTSASIDFEAQGVQIGDVAHLIPPRVKAGQVTYPTTGQLLAVDSVSGPALTLRRIGLAAGMGDPPASPGVGSAAFKFAVPTLYPQILDASRDLRQVYGLDDLVWGRRTADLYDLLQFTEVCAFKVLYLRYLEMARAAGEGQADDFTAKSSVYQDQLQSALDRLSIHFKPSPLPSPELTRFNCRIVR